MQCCTAPINRQTVDEQCQFLHIMVTITAWDWSWKIFFFHEDAFYVGIRCICKLGLGHFNFMWHMHPFCFLRTEFCCKVMKNRSPAIQSNLHHQNSVKVTQETPISLTNCATHLYNMQRHGWPLKHDAAHVYCHGKFGHSKSKDVGISWTEPRIRKHCPLWDGDDGMVYMGRDVFLGSHPCPHPTGEKNIWWYL